MESMVSLREDVMFKPLRTTQENDKFDSLNTCMQSHRYSVCDNSHGKHDDRYSTIVEQIPQCLNGLWNVPHCQDGGEVAHVAPEYHGRHHHP